MSKVIYIWNNGNSTSDFCPEDNIDMGDLGHYSSNAHSGGIIVIADSLTEAKRLVTLHIGKDYKDKLATIPSGYKPVVIDLSKSGIVLYADGDC